MVEKIGLLERNDTHEVSFIVKKNFVNTKENRDEQYFIGKILFKALLKNLSVNYCINNISIIKNLMFLFSDKHIYNPLKNLIIQE